MNRSFLAAFVVGLALVPSLARGGDESRLANERCLAAAEAVQSFRDQGKFDAARKQIALCTKDECPAIVRRDCNGWLDEVQKAQPTVVVSARDRRGDVFAARLLVDGVVRASRLDGIPIAVDSGEHTLRVEFEQTYYEEKFVAVVGEKNRLVRLSLPDHRQERESEEKNRERQARPVPVAAYILGGVGVAALGTSAFLGIGALSDADAFKAQPCAATSSCNAAEADAIQTRATVSVAALGVGVLALGLATWIVLSR